MYTSVVIAPAPSHTPTSTHRECSRVHTQRSATRPTGQIKKPCTIESDPRIAATIASVSAIGRYRGQMHKKWIVAKRNSSTKYHASWNAQSAFDTPTKLNH